MSDPILEDAKRAVNLPELFRSLYPHADFSGLHNERGGTIKDPRPDYEEGDGSLSISRNASGTWLYNQHNGSSPGRDAITLLRDASNLPFQEARAELIKLAGLIDTPFVPRKGTRKARPSVLKNLQEKQRNKPPLTLPASGLRGWTPITASMVTDAPERVALEARGLWSAIQGGRLKTFVWNSAKSTPSQKTILPDAMLIEIIGPDGQAIAYKARNRGSKAELDAMKIRRYNYLGTPGNSPAWCSRVLDSAGINAEIWVEGELNAAAVAEALLSVGIASVAVQGIAGASNAPHVTHEFSGRKIYIYADPPEDKARATWMALAHEGGAEAYLLPFTLFTQDGGPDRTYDACDSLAKIGAAALGERLRDAMATASQPTADDQKPVGPLTHATVHDGYAVEDNRMLLCRFDRHGNPIREFLCVFSARISQQREHIQADGSTVLYYVISGFHMSGAALKSLEVSAAEFGSMNWVARWGVLGLINAGQNKRDHVRAAIMSQSQQVPTITIYHQTGWIAGPSGWIYATHGASIGQNGVESTVNVDLSQYARLDAYALPSPPSDERVRLAVRASLQLFKLAPDHIAVPVLGMTYRAPLGSPRYVVMLAGLSGSGKTSFAALAQSHFGATWNVDYLPASWMQTAFSTMTASFAAAHTLMVVDDYKPAGTPAEMLKSEGEMAKVVAAAGDRTGRSRGTADGRSVHGGAYPRAALIVTGELNSQRYSDNARIVNVDFNVRLVDTIKDKALFSAAQKAGTAGTYSEAMSGYVQWIARHSDLFLTDGAFLSKIRNPLRAEFASPHARTPENMADLAGAWRTFLTFGLSCGAITPPEAQTYWDRVMRALQFLSVSQADVLNAVDPVDRALSLLSSIMRTGKAYVVDQTTGGRPNPDPQNWGWRQRLSLTRDERPTEVWEPAHNALQIGHLTSASDAELPTLYLDPAATYTALNQVAMATGRALPDPRTLWKRMKERLEPHGLMLCEADKTTHRRQVFGSKDRIALLNLRANFSEATGTTGTEEVKESTKKTFVFVPVTD